MIPGGSPAPILLATPEPDGAPPRMQLVITVPEGEVGVSAVITRHDPNGAMTVVREANPATITDNTWTGYDYECPFGADVTYTAAILLDDDSELAGLSETVNLNVLVSWLIHIGAPSLSVAIPRIRVQDDVSRPVRQGVFEPYGRTDPIVRTDGRRKNIRSAITVRTDTLGELDSLIACLASASTLLLNVPASKTWGIRTAYISVGDVTERRVDDANGSFEGRLVTLPYYVITAPPVGASQSRRTWADLMAEADTWADAMALYATWSDAVAPTVY